MRKHWFPTLVAAATMAFGIGGVVTASAATTTQPTYTSLYAPARPHVGTVASSSVTCTYTNVLPADSYKGLPPSDASYAQKPYSATLYTTQGAITFQADTTAAPCTTNSFAFLAENGYYNQTHCHRLTTEGIYVLQCGDPTGTGSGGPGYQFPDENLTGATYPAGTVAMANAGPNTNGSQFFICWKDTTLSPAYTPFGQVTSGLKVLQKIAAAGDDQQNGPGDGYPTLYVGFKDVKITTG